MKNDFLLLFIGPCRNSYNKPQGPNYFLSHWLCWILHEIILFLHPVVYQVNHERSLGSNSCRSLEVTYILTESPLAQQKHKVDLFHKLRHVMNELIDLRRQLIQGHLAQDQTREIKRHITVRLDWGNEWVGLALKKKKRKKTKHLFSNCRLLGERHVSLALSTSTTLGEWVRNKILYDVISWSFSRWANLKRLKVNAYPRGRKCKVIVSLLPVSNSFPLSYDGRPWQKPRREGSGGAACGWRGSLVVGCSRQATESLLSFPAHPDKVAIDTYVGRHRRGFFLQETGDLKMPETPTRCFVSSSESSWDPNSNHNVSVFSLLLYRPSKSDITNNFIIDQIVVLLKTCLNAFRGLFADDPGVLLA